MIVAGFHGLLKRDDSMADVDAALGRNLQIAFCYVPQEWVGVELSAGPLP